MAKQIKPVTPPPTDEEPKGRTTEEIVKRHYENEDDIITDEDIKNAVIETDVPDEVLDERFPPESDGKGKTDADGEPKTPWDILKD